RAADIDADGLELDILLVPDRARERRALGFRHFQMLVKEVGLVHPALEVLGRTRAQCPSRRRGSIATGAYSCTLPSGIRVPESFAPSSLAPVRTAPVRRE